MEGVRTARPFYLPKPINFTRNCGPAQLPGGDRGGMLRRGFAAWTSAMERKIAAIFAADVAGYSRLVA